MSNPEATEEELAQAAAAVGVGITAQGLVARFAWSAAELLRRLLEVADGLIIAARPAAVPVLQRFNGVYIQDSASITLPDVLADLWQGSGANSTHAPVAGLKAHVQWDYSTGRLSQLVLQDGCPQDRDAPIQAGPLPAGAFRLAADLGNPNLPVLANLSANSVYWLTRPQVHTLVLTPAGHALTQVQLLRDTPPSEVD